MRETGGKIETINTSKYIHGFVAGEFDGLPDLSKPAPSATKTKIQKKAPKSPAKGK